MLETIYLIICGLIALLCIIALSHGIERLRAPERTAHDILAIPLGIAASLIGLAISGLAFLLREKAADSIVAILCLFVLLLALGGFLDGINHMNEPDRTIGIKIRGLFSAAVSVFVAWGALIVLFKWLF